MRHLSPAICGLLLFLARSASADHLELRDDPDLGLAYGHGTFLGSTNEASFQRLQLYGYFHLDLALLRSEERHWFNRLSAYANFSSETTSVGYQQGVKTPPVPDGSGGMGLPPLDATIRAQVSTPDVEWSWGVGGRLGLYERRYFHLDLFAEWAGSLGSERDRIDGFTLRAPAIDFDYDATRLMSEHAKVSSSWSMRQFGATIAFPLDVDAGNAVRLSPFLIVGYAFFDSRIDFAFDDELKQDLAKVGLSGKVPATKIIEESNVTGAAGIRLDLFRRHSLECSAAFIKTDDLLAYWFTGSYTIRFTFPWRKW